MAPTWPRCRSACRGPTGDREWLGPRPDPAGHAHAHQLPGGRPEENAYPDILGGDQKAQIEAVRAYLLSLDRGGAR